VEVLAHEWPAAFQGLDRGESGIASCVKMAQTLMVSGDDGVAICCP